jgi:stalled ribosome rescue protein Dom34
MATHYHAVIWIDHLNARVFHIGFSGTDEIVLHPEHPTRHIHHKANTIGSGHSHEEKEFLKRVADAVADAGAILVTGPAEAKIELNRYIKEHYPQIARRIVGIETVDHPSDREIVAFAKRYFKAEDRMHGI